MRGGCGAAQDGEEVERVKPEEITTRIVEALIHEYRFNSLTSEQISEIWGGVWATIYGNVVKALAKQE